MPLISYRDKAFTPEHERVIEQADAICGEYANRGLSLTLRQLYYQFVARGLIANKQTEYKRLGSILNDARMAGRLDWAYLVDRTRNLASQSHWATPADIVKAVSTQFQIDMWEPQGRRIEVWIEKDAGIGVIESVCVDNDVPYFSCRGYTSVSELWAASQRLGAYLRNGERVKILHIGDHDPSGLDMTRDIQDRLRTFIHDDWDSDHHVPGTASGGRRSRGDFYRSMNAGMKDGGDGMPWQVKRIALSMEQVELYNPPPNPAKTTDARFLAYQEATGLDESWELDALDPFVLQDLIATEIDAWRDDDVWGAAVERLEKNRRLLAAVSENWDSIREEYGNG
jgi:hypothetical protein